MAELAHRAYAPAPHDLTDLGAVETGFISVEEEIGPKSIGSVLQIVGSPSFGLVGGSATTEQFVSAQAMVATNSDADTWFVAVRGSSDFGDALTDLNIAFITRDGVNYHQGFFIYASALLGPIMDAVNNCQDGRTVWISGHSLGGASAFILAYWLAEEGCNVGGVVTFGAPAPASPVFSQVYRWAGLDHVTHRWTNLKDPISCLPLGPAWGRVGLQHTITRSAEGRDSITLVDDADLCDGIGDSLGRSAFGYFLKVHDSLDIAQPFPDWINAGLQQTGLCYSDRLWWRIVQGVLTAGASEATCASINNLASARSTMDQIIRMQSLLVQQDPKNFAYHEMSWYADALGENAE